MNFPPGSLVHRVATAIVNIACVIFILLLLTYFFTLHRHAWLRAALPLGSHPIVMIYEEEDGEIGLLWDSQHVIGTTGPLMLRQCEIAPSLRPTPGNTRIHSWISFDVIRTAPMGSDWKAEQRFFMVNDPTAPTKAGTVECHCFGLDAEAIVLCLMFSFGPFLVAQRYLARWGRRVDQRRAAREEAVQKGLTCGHCGYDLRATPARCPECGTVPPTS